MSHQLLLDELQPREVLMRHAVALKRGDFIQIVDQVTAKWILDATLDEGDRDQSFALGYGHDFVKRV